MTSGTWSLDISDAGRLIRDRRLAPTELLASVLDRLDRVEPHILAFVHVDHDGARRAARALDDEITTGAYRGPLHGIPVAVKDMLDVAGFPTRRGSRAFADAPPAAKDATVVARLRSAGAVIVGKTTTHELALGSYTPPTRNPHDLTRIPGGSSGGSGAAVAAGAAMAAIGTDTAGSVRIPASFCGIVGVKPTYGRVPLAGVVELSRSLDTAGPLTRTVDDAALVLAAMAAGSAQPADRTSSEAEVSLQGLRLGVVREMFCEQIEPEVLDAFERSLRVLTDAGAVIIDVPLPEMRTAMETMFPISGFEYAAYYAATLRTRADLLDPVIRGVLERGTHVTELAYRGAKESQQRLRDAVRAALDRQRTEVLLTPTVPARPVPPDRHMIMLDGAQLSLHLVNIRNTLPFNVTGQPAISMPAARSSDGLPIGLQLAAANGADDRLMAIAAACERVLRKPGYEEPAGLVGISAARI